MSALTRYEELLDSHPKRGAGLHQSIMSLANLGVIAGLTDQEMLVDINAIADVKPNEASDAISKARGSVVLDNEQHQTSDYSPERRNRLDEFIKGIDNNPATLWEMSPTRLGDDYDQDCKLLIESLYKPDDILFVGDRTDSKVYPVHTLLRCNLASKPFIIPNPMTGTVGKTKSGKESLRCDDTVLDARYAVCEMDNTSFDNQVAFWVKCITMKLPVACVIHSGGKSLHGWMYVDCKDSDEYWDVDVKGWLFNEFGKTFGLDSACSNKSRLSRMPSHFRNNGEQQRLLYLNKEHGENYG